MSQLLAFVAGATVVTLGPAAARKAVLDSSVSAQLLWLASTRAPVMGANTAASITCGNVGAVTASSLGPFFDHMQPGWATRDRAAFCAVLLANGCFMDTEHRLTQVAVLPASPFVCSPIGLGSRFLSVLRGPSYVGGVTDSGNFVLFGQGANWNRCAVIRGPFTAMVTAQVLTPTVVLGVQQVTVSAGVDLCALDTAGALRCWEDLPSTWATAARPWVPASASDDIRPGSLCMEITGNWSLLRPSPRMCPQAAAASSGTDCVAPYPLSSFSLSPCRTAGSYIIGVRAADRLPVAWLVGAETWEAPAARGALSLEPLGILNVSGQPVQADPRIPPLWRCTDSPGQRVFFGRAADGSGYFEEPEARQQGSGGLAVLPRRRQNASAVGLTPMPALYTYFGTGSPYYMSSDACGPFGPFSHIFPSVSGAANNEWFASAGIRATDGSIQLPGQSQSHLLPASPIQVSTLAIAPGADLLCATFAPTSASHDGLPYGLTWEAKCAGPPGNAAVVSVHSGAHYQGFAAKNPDDVSPRCMLTPPVASAVSRRTFAVTMATIFQAARGANRPTAGAVNFYGYNAYGSSWALALPTLSPIKNATALALQPGAGSFVCAIISPSRTVSCVSSSGNAPSLGLMSDRPGADVAVSLLAATEAAACVTLASTGALWCFASSISSYVASTAAAGLPTAVPPGTSASGALMIQVNVTSLAASEALFCFIYSNATVSARLACIGNSSDPVVTAALSGARAAGFGSGPTSLSDWASSRGGSAAPLSLQAVSVGVAHACVLNSLSRAWCWGADGALGGAVIDVNADDSRFARIVAGGNSTCGYQFDGRLRCFGLLSRYIQDGHRSSWNIGNVSTSSGGSSSTDDPFAPVAASAGGHILIRANAGNDDTCNCLWAVEAVSDISASNVSACATLAGALAAGTRCNAAASGTLPVLTIWISGAIAATGQLLTGENSSVVVPVNSALLLLRGAPGSNASIVFSPCRLPSAGGSSPDLGVCMAVPEFAVPGIVLQDVTLVSSTGSGAALAVPRHCTSVFASAVLTRLFNVTFAGWNCTGPLVALTSAASTATAAFSLSQAHFASVGASSRGGAALIAGFTAEVVGAHFARCSSSAAIQARRQPGVRIAGVSSANCTFESVVFIDQVVSARIEDIRVGDSVSAPATPNASSSALLPGSGICGAVVRINNVAAAQISTIAVSRLEAPDSLGGGAVCLTDADSASAGATVAVPRPLRIIVERVDVSDCTIGNQSTLISTADSSVGGGCAFWGSLARSPQATVSIAHVRVGRSAAAGDGAGIFARIQSISIYNVSCTDTFSGGSGGCIAADAWVSVGVSAVTTLRSLAVAAGGAIWLRARSAPLESPVVSLQSCEFTDSAALGSDGGAISLEGDAAVQIASLTCKSTRALRGSGGCVAAKLQGADSATRAVSVDVAAVSASACSAGFRGGGLSLTLGVIAGNQPSVRISNAVFASNAVSGAACSSELPPSGIAFSPFDSRPWWNTSAGSAESSSSASAAASLLILALLSQPLQPCAAPEDGIFGGGAVSLVFSRGVASIGSSADSDGITSPRIALQDVALLHNTVDMVGSAVGVGGALLVSRTETAPSLALLNLCRAVLLNNTAVGDGGGIYVRSTLASASNVSVTLCTSAAGDGGGIYAADSALNAYPSFVLAHNRAPAGSGGGAAFSSCILGGLQLLGEARSILAPSASPTPSMTSSTSFTAIVSQSSSASRSLSPSNSASRAASQSPTTSATVTQTRTPSISLTSTQTPSVSGTPMSTPTPSPAPLPGDDNARTAALNFTLSRWLTTGSVSIINNTAAVSGGGLALLSCDTVVGGATIIGNSAGEGGGVFAEGSGGLHLCAVFLLMNGATTYGGGAALLDTSRKAHLCDEAACSRYLLLTSPTASSARTAGSSEARLPFKILLAALSAQARSTIDAVGGLAVSPRPAGFGLSRNFSAILRGAAPPAPALFSVNALLSSMTTAAEAAALSALVTGGLVAGAGDAATCAWAANSASFAGGDVSFRSASLASAVADAGRPMSFLRRAFMFFGTAAKYGGSVYVAASPVSLSQLDIVAAAAGDAFICSDGSTLSSDVSMVAALPCNISFSASTKSSLASAADVARSGGFGGAVALVEPVYTELVGIRAVSAFARFGGSLWIQPFLRFAAAPSSVNLSSSSQTADAMNTPAGVGVVNLRVLDAGAIISTQVSRLVAVDAGSGGLSFALAAPPSLDGRLLMIANAFLNTSAAAGGSAVFIHGALRSSFDAAALTTATNNSQQAVSSLLPLQSQLRSAALASVSGIPVVIITTASMQLDGGDIAYLVSLAPASTPLAVLQLRDAFNSTTSYDDSTECSVSVISDDGRSSLSLMFPPRYTAVAGVVTLSPFGIASAPGSSGRVQVSCFVALGSVAYTLSAVLMRVTTVKVRLRLDAVAAASSLLAPASAVAFCNNSLLDAGAGLVQRRPPPGSLILTPVLMPTVSGSRVWEPDWHVQLTLTDVIGRAVSPPAALPCSLFIDSAIDPTTGAAVQASLIAYGSIAASGVDLSASSARVPIAVAGSAGAELNISASCRWPSGEAVISAAPLSVAMAQLHLAWVVGAVSPPAINFNSSNGSASCSLWTMSCGSSASVCPLELDAVQSVRRSAGAPAAAATSSLAAWSSQPAWQLNVSVAALQSGASEGTTLLPQLLGVSDVWSRDQATGRALVVGAPKSVADIAVSPILNPTVWSTEWSQSTAAMVVPSALPSSPDGLQLLPLGPAPSFVLIAYHRNLPAPMAFPEGGGLCTATLTAPLLNQQLPAQAAIVGTAATSMAQGRVAFPALGVSAVPMGNSTAVWLRVQCALSGGEASVAATVPIRVPSLQASVVSTPPAILAPSTDLALAPLQQPLAYAFTLQGLVATTANFTSEQTNDGGVSAALRSVGAKVQCTLACEPQHHQPCTLSGRTAAVLDVSGDRWSAATAAFEAFGFSHLARHTNTTCVSASCVWLDGQKVTTPRFCAAQPAASVVWCDNSTVGCELGALVPAAVANEPLSPFGVIIRSSPPDGLALLHLEPGALRCSLLATASSDQRLGDIIIRSAADVVADPTTGITRFAGVSLQLTTAQEAELASAGFLQAYVTASCYAYGVPFASSQPRIVRIPQLRAAWAAPPPSVLLPASATMALPFDPPVVVALADATDASTMIDVAGSCSVSVIARWLPPDAVALGANLGEATLRTDDTVAGSAPFLILLGSTTRQLFGGKATFPDLALAGSMGASATLRASCTRNQGGEVAPSEMNLTVAHAAVSWKDAEPWPRTILSARALARAVQVSWGVIPPAFAAAHSWRWSCSDGSGSNASACAQNMAPAREPLPPALQALPEVHRVTCALSLTDDTVTASASPADMVQFSAEAVSANTTAASGIAAFIIDVSGAGGRSARFQPYCSIGGNTFRAVARSATLATVSIQLAAELPSAWLPSDGSATTYLQPVPRLRLLASDGFYPETRGATCTVTVGATIGRASRTVLAELASASSALNTSSIASLAVHWPPAFSASLPGAPSNGYFTRPGAGGLDPVSIDTLAVRAGFGDFVALQFKCERSNNDPTLIRTVILRMSRLASTWLRAPPQEVAPGSIFEVTILLFDADASGRLGRTNNASGTTDAFALSISPAEFSLGDSNVSAVDVYAFDSVTTCQLVPTSLFDASGRQLDVSTVVVQGGTATAVAGVVLFPAAAVTARVGTTVRGRVDCSTGSFRSAESAPTWTIAMSPCPPGSAPAGNGASCVNCGRSYSDGGPSASACVSCPSVGAACSGGILLLLPGFYRADGNPTIDEHTELHPCALPFACWVNSTATNRSAAATHGCNEGYAPGSVLCGVCDAGYARTGKKCGRCLAPAASWAVTALVPAAVLLFGAWAAQRSINEASPFAPLTRIGLGHIQLLGALMGAFVASGTGLVKELLGFAEVAGASPLAVAPVHCAFGGLTFYTRFLLTLALAPALMFATMAAQVALACRQRCKSARPRASGLPPASASRNPATLNVGVHGVRMALTRRASVASVLSPAPSISRGELVEHASSSRVLNPLCAAADAQTLTSAAPSAPSTVRPEETEVDDTPAAARSGPAPRCCSRVRRAIDDPRVTGPAVFVLVSGRHSPAPDCKPDASHVRGVGDYFALFFSSSSNAELPLSIPHHSGLQRLQLYIASNCWRPLPHTRFIARVRHIHA